MAVQSCEFVAVVLMEDNNRMNQDNLREARNMEEFEQYLVSKSDFSWMPDNLWRAV